MAQRKAFSLVEVTLAIAVLSFAMLALMGTLPVGLGSLNQSMARTVVSNILRGVSSEVRQSDFAALTALSVTGKSAGLTWFDAEGFPADSDPSRQAFAAVVAVTDPGTVSNPSIDAINLPSMGDANSSPNSKIKMVSVSVFRGEPLADEANIIGSGTFFVGDNGR